MLAHERDDLESGSIGELHPREISREQMQKFEGYIAEILTTLGMDLNMPATYETPQRFVQAMFDATEGYDGDPNCSRC